jgi:hypothetical protein
MVTNTGSSLRSMQNKAPATMQKPAGKHAVLVYPNPAKHKVMVMLQQPPLQPYSIIVRDAVGRLYKTVQHVRNISYELDISRLPKGMYIIQINAGNSHRVVEKVLVE